MVWVTRVVTVRVTRVVMVRGDQGGYMVRVSVFKFLSDTHCP